VALHRDRGADEFSGPPAAWPTLQLLACPLCRGDLVAANAGLECPSCGRNWNPDSSGWLDFRDAAGELLGEHWSGRQTSMEGWYENLITASAQAESCYRHDYEPLGALLGDLRGRVLDVGGGNGIVRQYARDVDLYVDLDPSPAWLTADWLAVAEAFPALRSPITFVLGVGERMPFRESRFDAVLSLFSINHCADPEAVITEIARVLRPGGRLVLVAEDVEPRWLDLPKRGYRAGWTPVGTALKAKLATVTRRARWPVHPEHIPISERQLRRWLAADFELERRSWIAGWLTLEAIAVGSRDRAIEHGP